MSGPQLQWTEAELAELETLDIPTIIDRHFKNAAAQWYLELRSQLRTDMVEYATLGKLETNSHRRRNFEIMVHKLFYGDAWEVATLHGMRLDLRLLCCLSLVPRQFLQIHQHGLAGHFAAQFERIVGRWEVPDWILERFEWLVRRYKDRAKVDKLIQEIKSLKPPRRRRDTATTGEEQSQSTVMSISGIVDS